MLITVKLLTGEKMEFRIDGSSCTIGRSPKCQVVIAHDGVSRQHCLLEIQNGEAFVTDLASTNGVMIDGEKIRPSVRTEFKTYLPISFGPVQSLLVDLQEESTGVSTANPLLKGVSISDTVTRKNLTKERKDILQQPSTPKPPIERKKPGIDPKMIFATIIAIGIMAFAYHLHQMQNESTPPMEVERVQGPVEYY